MNKICEHCGSLLIEIGWYGQPLLGCTRCNTWEDVGDVQLDPENLAALKEMVRDEGKNADDVVRFAIAHQEADSIESYLARGRHFKDFTNEALNEKFVDTIRKWALHVEDFAIRTTAFDVVAEHELRGLLPPHGLVSVEMKMIGRETVRLFRNLPESRQEEIAAEIASEYKGAQKDRH
jgi:hypothetical protein